MNKVSIYVPTTIYDKPADMLAAQVAVWVARRLSSLYGGATKTPGIGYYVADNGSLIIEPVHIVSSLYDVDNPCAVNRIARVIKRVMSQESVLIERTQSEVTFL